MDIKDFPGQRVQEMSQNLGNTEPENQDLKEVRIYQVNRLVISGVPTAKCG